MAVGVRRVYDEPGADRDDAVAALADRARSGSLTLVYAARDVEHNNAVVLRDLVEERLDDGQR